MSTRLRCWSREVRLGEIGIGGSCAFTGSCGTGGIANRAYILAPLYFSHKHEHRA